jgi:hypothetical protein
MSYFRNTIILTFLCSATFAGTPTSSMSLNEMQICYKEIPSWALENSTKKAQVAPTSEELLKPITGLQSLVGAPALILIDFDGGHFQHSYWNSGEALDVASSGIIGNQATEIWQRVSELYKAFNINVTTDTTLYEAMPNNRKVRVVVTPTKIHAGGGVAERGSFQRADDSPAWVFASSSYSNYWVSLAVAHEAGHTLGLGHDGTQTGQTYYKGQGIWNPIMGSHGTNLNHWSKGEYDEADNFEDDISIITQIANGVTLKEDTQSGSFFNAPSLRGSATSLVDSGIIESASDVDAFFFATNGGNIQIEISSHPFAPTVDVKAWIEDSTGSILSESSPSGDFDAFLSGPLSAGRYVLKVEGDGDPAQTGHSDYGSLGSYYISGSINGFYNSISPTQNGLELNWSFPTSGDTLGWNGQAIDISSIVKENDQSLSSFKIYADGTEISYQGGQAKWQPTYFGDHLLRAVAVDASGNQVEKSIHIFLRPMCIETIPASNIEVVDFSSELNIQFVVPSLAEYAVDGDSSSVWSTDFTDTAASHPHFIELDFGNETETSGMDLYLVFGTQNNRPMDYSILGSNNQSDWTSLTGPTSADPQAKSHFINWPSSSYRFLRFYVESSAGESDHLKLNELTFYSSTVNCEISPVISYSSELDRNSSWTLFDPQGRVLWQGSPSSWNEAQALLGSGSYYLSNTQGVQVFVKP